MMGLFNPSDFESSYGTYEDTPLSLIGPGDYGYEPAPGDWSILNDPQTDWAYGSGPYDAIDPPTFGERVLNFFSGTVAPLADTAGQLARTWSEYKNLDQSALALESPAPRYVKPTEQARFNMGAYKKGAPRTKYVGPPPGQGLAGALAPNVLLLLVAVGLFMLKGK